MTIARATDALSFSHLSAGRVVMSYSKKILCLAKSWKKGGHCIAGRTYSSEEYLEWVRPVSDRANEEVSDYECGYQGGGGADVLDFVEVPLLRAVPKDHQVENHLLDPTKWWTKVQKGRKATWDDLELAVQSPSSLWENGDSSFNGVNDRVAEALLARQGSSLYLIRPENVKITVGPEGPPGQQRRKARVSFDYNDVPYSLLLTDPVASNDYLSRPDGTYEEDGDVLFCVSLGTVFGGDAYKLVAGMFTPKRTSGAR